MSIRDLFHKMPETKQELSDYILRHEKHIKSEIDKNPDCKENLDSAVENSSQKYLPYINNKFCKATGMLSGAGHAWNYWMDEFWLETGLVKLTMGGKYFGCLAQIPEKIYGMYYAVRTGNYLDSAQNLLEGIVGLAPGLTFVDQGISRIIKKRMVKSAVTEFKKDVGIYRSWTTKLAENLVNYQSKPKTEANKYLT